MDLDRIIDTLNRARADLVSPGKATLDHDAEIARCADALRALGAADDLFPVGKGTLSPVDEIDLELRAARRLAVEATT